MSSLRTQRRSWKCYLCGTDIVEGQRFTFTSRGPIHWECFRVEVAKAFNNRIPEDVEFLLELIDYFNEGIVKIKEGEYRMPPPYLGEVGFHCGGLGCYPLHGG